MIDAGNLLLTGASGLFGTNFQRLKPAGFNIVPAKSRIRDHAFSTIPIDVDLADQHGLEKVLVENDISFVVNAAGMTDVELCEARPEEAFRINGELAGVVAAAAANTDVKLLHMSTDHIFDGIVPLQTETAIPKPINVYGKSKALGEELVLSKCPDAVVVRCNFFGWGPRYRRSFSDFIYDRLSNNLSVDLAGDVFFSPASTNRLVWAVAELLKLNVNGVFNAVGCERVSKLAFGQILADVFDFSPTLIREVSLDQLPLKTVRPRDMSLCDKKITSVLGQGLGTPLENLKILRSDKI